MHLFGFTIEIYYDARSYERQIIVVLFVGSSVGNEKRGSYDFTGNTV